ncbi:MAG: hypothetical protein WA001_01265 [Patescibacteria group bacterium]
MLFPHKRVYEARLEDLDDPKHFERVVTFFHGDIPPRDERREWLRTFLEALPPAEDLLKISDRLHAIATDHKASIRDLEWWDIVSPKERWLYATVVRDGYEILCAFYWKSTKKGSTPHYAGSKRSSWARHISIQAGWRFEIECETYQEMKAELRAWLASPLKLPERWGCS